jgi:hypothetical protein
MTKRWLGVLGASTLALGLFLTGCQAKQPESYLAPAARGDQPPPGRPEALDVPQQPTPQGRY